MSVRSTALRYSELASREVTKGRLILEPEIYQYTECNVLKLFSKPEKPESLSSSGLDATRVTLEYIGALCLLGLLKLLMLVLLEKCRKKYKSTFNIFI